MHALFQRANFDHFMMRDPARDYKDVVFLPTFIVAALVGLLSRNLQVRSNKRCVLEYAPLTLEKRIVR